MSARESWLVLSVVGVSLFGVAACSDWPGLNEKPRGAMNGVSGTSTGTCSGTPIPCQLLSGADCSASPGCADNGTCGGTTSSPGQSCATAFSFQGCNAIVGCVWNDNCTGTSFGTCSGYAEQQCVPVRGCTWTSTGTGGASSGAGAGGATSGACNTFGSSCRSSTDCTCGLSCVSQCPTCSSTCGTPCQSDADCASATGQGGVATPFCAMQVANPVAPFSGICSSSR